MNGTRNPASYLPYLIGPLDFQIDGVAIELAKRSTINIAGGTIEDDDANDRTNIIVTGEGQVIRRTLAVDYTNNNNAGQTALTGLSFAVSDGDVWIVEFGGNIQCSGIGGVKFGFHGPTGSLCEGAIHGERTTDVNTYGSVRVSDSVTPTYVGAFAAVASLVEGIWGTTRIKCVGAGGTVTLGCRPVTNAQVATMKAGFWIRASRAVEV